MHYFFGHNHTWNFEFYFLIRMFTIALLNYFSKEGNSSRARRIGRICQQYQDAMKLHKSGKPIPIEDLPTPPGFGPIPDPRSGTTPSASPSVPGRGTMSAQTSGGNISAGAARPPPSPQPAAHAQPASAAASPSEAEKPKRKSMSLQVEHKLLTIEIISVKLSYS